MNLHNGNTVISNSDLLGVLNKSEYAQFHDLKTNSRTKKSFAVYLVTTKAIRDHKPVLKRLVVAKNKKVVGNYLVLGKVFDLGRDYDRAGATVCYICTCGEIIHTNSKVDATTVLCRDVEKHPEMKERLGGYTEEVQARPSGSPEYKNYEVYLSKHPKQVGHLKILGTAYLSEYKSLTVYRCTCGDTIISAPFWHRSHYRGVPFCGNYEKHPEIEDNRIVTVKARRLRDKEYRDCEVIRGYKEKEIDLLTYLGSTNETQYSMRAVYRCACGDVIVAAHNFWHQPKNRGRAFCGDLSKHRDIFTR